MLTVKKILPREVKVLRSVGRLLCLIFMCFVPQKDQYYQYYKLGNPEVLEAILVSTESVIARIQRHFDIPDYCSLSLIQPNGS